MSDIVIEGEVKANVADFKVLQKYENEISKHFSTFRSITLDR